MDFLLKYSKFFGDIILTHPYVFIFIGLFIGGESVLLPALYLGVIEKLNIWYVIGLMLVATALSDTVWYFVGRGLTKGFSYISINPKVQSHIDRLSTVFKERSLHILFFSKFIYGTRIAAQVLCGMYKIHFWRYFMVNFAGIIALAALYTGITYTLNTAISATDYPIFYVRILLVGAIAIVILAQVVLSFIVKKKWYQS